MYANSGAPSASATEMQMQPSASSDEYANDTIGADSAAGETAAALHTGTFIPHSVSTVYEDELDSEARDTTGAVASTSSGAARAHHDNAAETQAIEENLRRWSEKERVRRRNSRMRQSVLHEPLQSTSDGTRGLVRKLSSIRLPARQQEATGSSIEMISSSGFTRKPEYNPVGDASESSPLPSTETPQMPTIESGMFARDESYGDLASPSFDDIAFAGTYNALNKGKNRAIYTPSGNTSEVDLPAVEKRKKPVPLVTAGGMSSRQYRQSHMQVPRSGTSDQRDTMYTSPFDGAERLPSANSMSTMNKILPDTSMQDVRFSDPSTSSVHVSQPDENERGSWYWSDILCGCGFFSSRDDDDEQAAHTNPME